MAKVYVDNKPYEMNPEENLLHGCVSQGLNLPYFCWHPALGSVGACRQCAVKVFKDEHDTEGKIVMSCMTPAAEGTRISIADPEAASFRAGVIEGLMLNHPHDCPVCDEGGECHLQDMTVMTGHDYRRYEFDKRTFRDQNLGPLVNHETEPVHPVLPLRALLPRLRGRQRFERIRLAQHGIFRPERRRCAGE